MQKLLVMIPDQRITADEAIKHPYVSAYQFDNFEISYK